MGDNYYGWRTRIALLTPSVNTATEVEFNRLLPDGVSVHAARLGLPSPVDVEAVRRMNDDVPQACALLADIEPDIAVYGVTSGSFVEGKGGDIDLEETVADRLGVPAVATAAAARRAFDALGIESIVIRTPYLNDINRTAKTFFEAYGYDVLEISGEEFETTADYGNSTPEGVYRAVRSMDHEAADAIFISGMEYHGVPILRDLEADLDKPVITAHSATLWDTLRTAEVDYSELDLGRLFEE
ncbi:MAG: maleate cis-trans isomerase [Salinirussus sp.]